MKRRHSSLLSVTAVLLLLVLLLFGVQRLLVPKYQTVSEEGALPREYYEETTTHDVLFLGDCEVFSNFSPVTLWNEYGIPSYIRGGAQQLVWHSYYTLKDTLKTETPKVVVYNVLALKYGEPQSEAYNRLNLDGLRLSKNKLDAVKASKMEDEDTLSYVFPLLRYHARWSILTEEDITYYFRQEPVSHNGYLMRVETVPLTTLPTPPTLSDPNLPETSMAYLERMATLCAENGITLVLVKSPSVYPHWYDSWDVEIQTFAQEHGLSYYNLLARSDEIGIDLSTDTCDMGQHLNVFGAEKLTLWFGKELKTQFSLPNRQDEEPFASVWTEKTDHYEKEKARLLAALE